jgi:tRNA:m4X modification enzyme
MVDAGLVESSALSTDAVGTASEPGTEPATESTAPEKRKPLYAELGAGRGYLSHFLLDAYGPLDVVLVERETYRFKAERSVGRDADARREKQKNDARRASSRCERSDRAADADADAADADADDADAKDRYRKLETEAETVRLRRAGSVIERLRVDIKDLNFSGVELARGRDVVFIGKHLCGSATDLSLRCLLEPARGGATGTPETKKKTLLKNGYRPLGVCVATCCHHRCEWGSYVNREFMLEHGFGAKEFGWFAKMSSWATERGDPRSLPRADSKRKRNESREEERAAAKPSRRAQSLPLDGLDVPNTEKVELGGMAKTFLDVGRLKYLEKFGFAGSVRGYVERNTSPENRVLVAKKTSEEAYTDRLRIARE